MPDIVTNLGRIIPLPTGNYNALTQYSELHEVIYQFATYRVKKDATPAIGTLPTNTTYWDKVATGPEGRSVDDILLIDNSDGTFDIKFTMSDATEIIRTSPDITSYLSLTAANFTVNDDDFDTLIGANVQALLADTDENITALLSGVQTVTFTAAQHTTDILDIYDQLGGHDDDINNLTSSVNTLFSTKLSTANLITSINGAGGVNSSAIQDLNTVLANYDSFLGDMDMFGVMLKGNTLYNKTLRYGFLNNFETGASLASSTDCTHDNTNKLWNQTVTTYPPNVGLNRPVDTNQIGYYNGDTLTDGTDDAGADVTLVLSAFPASITLNKIRTRGVPVPNLISRYSDTNTTTGITSGTYLDTFDGNFAGTPITFSSGSSRGIRHTFNTPVKIKGFAVSSNGTNYPTSFTIEHSANGSSWTTVYTNVTNSPYFVPLNVEQYEAFPGGAVTAKYWRISVTATNTGNLVINEFHLYEDDEALTEASSLTGYGFAIACDASYTFPTFQIRGSNDGSSWTVIHDQASPAKGTYLPGNQQSYFYPFATAQTWKYFQLYVPSPGSTVGITQFSVLQSSFDSSRIVLESNNIACGGAPKLVSGMIQLTMSMHSNYDLTTFEVSRDSGTTWTNCPFLIINSEGTMRYLAFDRVDISAQPSGTNVKWRLKTPRVYGGTSEHVDAVVIAWKL